MTTLTIYEFIERNFELVALCYIAVLSAICGLAIWLSSRQRGKDRWKNDWGEGNYDEINGTSGMGGLAV